MKKSSKTPKTSGAISVRPASLLAIDAELTQLAMLALDGETSPEIDAALVAAGKAALKKVDNYVALILTLENEAQAAKELLKKLANIPKRKEALASTLRDNLAVFMSNQNLEVLRPQRPELPAVRLGKPKDKLEFNEERLPCDLKDSEIVHKAKRDVIEKMLKANPDLEIPGVTRTQGAPFVIIQ